MYIMGILNVTPDSFSDGGLWADSEAAIAHGTEMIAAGATLIDIGGESTRPGADPVSPEDEWQRIEPVVRALAGKALLSIDTYHAFTARKAIEAGANIVNDVTGGHGDPEMFATVADLGVDYILQHGRGDAQSMNSLASYTDIVSEVAGELRDARDRAVAAGIAPEHIILDPGLGFAKLGDDDWQVLAGMETFVDMGHRVLVGPSRKRFLADVAQGVAAERDVATAVVSLLLERQGVWATRVHNVAATAQALATQHKLDAMADARAGEH